MDKFDESTPDGLDAPTRFRRALEAHDLDGMIAQLAPDFVLHSPLTDRIAVHVRDEMRELMEHHLKTVVDVRYFVDVGDNLARAQFYRAHVDGQQVEVATRLELDDDPDPRPHGLRASAARSEGVRRSAPAPDCRGKARAPAGHDRPDARQAARGRDPIRRSAHNLVRVALRQRAA